MDIALNYIIFYKKREGGEARWSYYNMWDKLYFFKNAKIITY